MLTSSSAHDDDKRAAAIAAVGEVRDGMLVGLGSGTTAAFAVAALGERRHDGLAFTAYASSGRTEQLARAAGIPILPFDDVAALDLVIDGADEIDPRLRAIKGGGGAMLREKVVAAAARRMVAIVDGSKQVERLGAAPLPVEVVGFATAFVAARLRALGADPTIRATDGQPYRTDQGNPILDCRFATFPDPAPLGAAIAAIPGVVGHGLFLDEVDALYVARDGRVERIERPATG